MPSLDRSLTVAVLTYQRRELLETILPALVDQAESVGSHGVAARVLVIDNSPSGNARLVVEQSVQANEWAVEVVYIHEPIPGIPAARNRALDASGESDLLAFIDDDERPSQSWLANLVRALDEMNAVAVAGPVVSEYAAEPSPWIEAGGFFHRLRWPTGTRLFAAATNNLLLDMSFVRRLGLRFDERLGMNGGDDTLFTRTLARAGPLVWCDEAVVVDLVPLHRLTTAWVVRRSLRSGNSWALSSLWMTDSVAARMQVSLAAVADGLARIAGGLVRVLVGVTHGRIEDRARGVRALARGAGMILGACGVSYLEYRRAEPPTSRRLVMARR